MPKNHKQILGAINRHVEKVVCKRNKKATTTTAESLQRALMMNSFSHVGTVIIIYSLLFDFSLTCDNNTCILLFIINISRMFSKVTKHNSLDLSKIQLIGNAVQFLSPMLSYHLELFLRRRQCSMQLVRSILAKYMKNNNNNKNSTL